MQPRRTRGTGWALLPSCPLCTARLRSLLCLLPDQRSPCLTTANICLLSRKKDPECCYSFTKPRHRHNPLPFCCAHHRRSLKALRAPALRVPVPGVAESSQWAAGTLLWLALPPCPHQPWQHRIKSSCPGSACSWLTPAEPPPHPAVLAVLALTCAMEKVPGDIPVPGWGHAQRQHWLRKGCHDATSTPAFIQVLPHAGTGLALKMPTRVLVSLHSQDSTGHSPTHLHTVLRHWHTFGCSPCP